MTAQDAPAGPAPGDRTKIADALAELVFVSGTHADWQQRPLKEQTERVIALISFAREEGRDAERERLAAEYRRTAAACAAAADEWPGDSEEGRAARTADRAAGSAFTRAAIIAGGPS